MQQPDPLFQLIKTLSIEEKRQFAKIAKVNKKYAVYEVLFKAMDKQKEYDENALKKKYAGEVFIKNLSARKKQLTDKLLDLLVGMNLSESTGAKIKHALTYLPILFERKQFVLMRKKINSTKKIATETEQFYLLLELLEWEKKMLWNDVHGNHSSKVDEVIAEQELCLQKFNEQFAYRNLRRRMSIINRKDVMMEKEENINAFKNLLKNPLLNDYLNFQSKIAEMHYCQIKINQKRIEHNFDESLSYAKKLIALCKDQKSINSNDYKMALHTYLAICDSAGKFEGFLDVVTQLENNLKENHSELHVFGQINFYRLRYYLETSQFDKALEIAKLLESRWQELSEHSYEGRYISICFNLMMLYWIISDLEETKNWLICIRNYDKAKSRKDDILLATRLFELIVYYELQEQGKDIDFDKKIDTVRKTLENNSQFQTFHRTVVQHCRNLNRAITKTEKTQIIKSLERDLQTIKMENPKLLCLDEIILWCQSKLQGLEMRELLKRKALVV